MPARISQPAFTSNDRALMDRGVPPVSTRMNSSDIVSAMDGLRRAALDPPAHIRHRARVSASHIPAPRASMSELAVASMAAASKQHACSHLDMRRIPESRSRAQVTERKSSKVDKPGHRSRTVQDDHLRDPREVEGRVSVAGGSHRRHSPLTSEDAYEGMQQEAGSTHGAKERYRPPSTNVGALLTATGYTRRTERRSDDLAPSGDDMHDGTQREAGFSRKTRRGYGPFGAHARIHTKELEQQAGGPRASSRHPSTTAEHVREEEQQTEGSARNAKDIHDHTREEAGSSRKAKERYGLYADPRVVSNATGRTKKTRRQSDNPAPSILKRSHSIRSSSGQRRSRHCSARLSVAEAEARQAESLLDVQLDGISGDQEQVAWLQEQKHFEAMRCSLAVLLDAAPGDQECSVRKHEQERVVSAEVTQRSPGGADQHRRIIDETPPWSPRTSWTAGAIATNSGEAASQGGETEARCGSLEFELPQVFVQVSDLPLRIQGIMRRRGSRSSRCRSGSAASESVTEPMLHDDVARALSALRSPSCCSR